MEIWLVVGVAALCLGLVAATGFLVARGRYNDGRVPVRRDLFLKGAPKTVMAIWAHPDDELIAAGALARMARRRKAKLVLVYLTAGEAARGNGARRQDLGARRTAEARAAGKILRASEVEVLDFPDGGLRSVDDAAARLAIGELIARHGPSILVTFDERIGYYSHPDQMQVGRWVREIVEQCADDETFPVRRVYHVTLPQGLLDMARRHVPAFRDNYPRDPSRALPAPTLAVRVSGQAGVKRRVARTYRSQAETIADVHPLVTSLPAGLLYRLLDREYFTLAASR